MEILGVSDINPEAPGFFYAKLGPFHHPSPSGTFHPQDLNLIIELTGSNAVLDEIFRKRPSGFSVIDHRGARLLWDLIQMEMEKIELEKRREKDPEESKKHTQVILDSLPYRVMVVNLDMTVDTVNRPS